MNKTSQKLSYSTKYPLKKENYRPITLFPQLSKLLWGIICKQIFYYNGNSFSNDLTGFRKLHGSQP